MKHAAFLSFPDRVKVFDSTNVLHTLIAWWKHVKLIGLWVVFNQMLNLPFYISPYPTFIDNYRYDIKREEARSRSRMLTNLL